jgi:putative DNA primase/helicase
MGIVGEYVAALASLNGEAVATVRGDAAMLATWQREGENVGLVWAALREAGHDERIIAELQVAVKRAIPPWWAEYRPDEAGQSDAFLTRCGADWAYVTGWERWHKWTGTHWQADQVRGFRLAIGDMLDDVHGEAMDRARELHREAEALAQELGNDDEDAKAAFADAKEAFGVAYAWRKTDKRINAIDNLCKDHRAQHPDSLSCKNLLNLANGTLDLDTYSLRTHDRADLLTHCLPYDLDPAATCPRWLQFLAEVLVKEDGRTPDPELAALFQEAIGYALTIETRYEAMFWFSGVGANGKTTAIKAVNALLGPLAVSLDLGALGRPDASYYLAKLGGARVVFSTEAAKGQNTGEDILKRLASGEPIPARPIRGEPITIQPVAKVLWAMNDKPNVKDTSDGFWRRLRLVPFYRQFAEHERDTQLAERLLGELPGILNWALDGLRRLRCNGRFTDAAAVRDAGAEYRTSQNTVALWLQERTTFALAEAQRPAGARTKAREAFQDYLQWAAATNRQRTMTETAFGTEAKKFVPHWKDMHGGWYALGLLVLDGGPSHPPTVSAADNDDGERAVRALGL